MSTTTFRRTGTGLPPRSCSHSAWGAATPVSAETGSPARITASVSDATPASGRTFRVSGWLTRGGDGLSGRTVKVQTLRDGSWTDLTGARMRTSSTGGYNLGVVLSQAGSRTLRVKAILPGHDAHQRFVATVH